MQKILKKENRIFDFVRITQELAKRTKLNEFLIALQIYMQEDTGMPLKKCEAFAHENFDQTPQIKKFRRYLLKSKCYSRPLTDISLEPNQKDPLTSNHFFQRKLNSTQTPVINDDTLNLQKKTRITQNLKDKLWERVIITLIHYLMNKLLAKNTIR